MRRILAMMVLAAALPSCAREMPTVWLGVGQSSEHLVPGSLRQTADVFFGEDSSSNAPASASANEEPSSENSLSGLIEADDLFNFKSARYDRTDYEDLRIGARQNMALGNRLTLWVQAEIGEARIIYDLPDGLGVLTDPTTITLEGLAGEAAVGLALHGPEVLGLASAVELGAGVSAARLDVSVSSALLDVRHQVTANQPFGLAAISVTGPDGGLQGRVGLRQSRDSGIGLDVGLRMRLN